MGFNEPPPEFADRDELVEYVARYGATDFLLAHTPAAARVAQRLWSEPMEGKGGIQIDDLINHGLYELWLAKDEWVRYEGGLKWSAFITSRMQFRMLDFIREHSRVGRVLTKRLKHVRRTAEALRQELNREPYPEELAARSGFSAEQIREIYAEFREREWIQVSATRKQKDHDLAGVRADSELTWNDVDRRGSQGDPSEQLPLAELMSRLLRRVGQHWDRVAFFCYFCLGLTMKDVGACINTSESRVSQAMSSIRRDLAQRVFPEEFGASNFKKWTDPDSDPLQRAMTQLWEILSEDKRQAIVEEFNLCSFARRPSAKERRVKRTVSVALPPGFRASMPKGLRSADGTLCLLVSNAAREPEAAVA